MSRFIVYLVSIMLIVPITFFATLALLPTLTTPVSAAVKNSAAPTLSIYATDPSQPPQSTGAVSQGTMLITQDDPMVQTSFQNIVIFVLSALIVGLITGVILGHQGGRGR